MDNFYRENILDHYQNPRNFGKLAQMHVSFEEYNPFCGDRIGMEIKLRTKDKEQRTIEDIKFHGEGCAISVASASLLTERVKGKNIDEVKKIGTKEILSTLGIELTPTRLKCALLPLEVLHKTLSLAKQT